MNGVDQLLKGFRDQIDEIDRELLVLINRRASLAQEIARIKASEQGEFDAYRPDREAGIRRAIADANQGPLSNEDVDHLFVELMSACRALERPMRIAYLGPEGTFTEGAVHRHFGRAVQRVSLETIDAVFREVESKVADYGVVPVENSTEGMISHTLDMLAQSKLSICGEIEMRIQQCLLGRCASVAEVEQVFSHQQSFAQCRGWLDRNLPKAPRWPLNSNAEAARRAAATPRAAAVAGKMAGETYGLAVLASNIEDQADNTTRFLVIGRRSVPRTGSDKTSLLLSAQNRPGALYGLLEPLARRGISMTRIESRPSRMARWEYVFFVDLEGHRDDANVASALQEIEREASLLKVLGSYPRVTE